MNIFNELKVLQNNDRSALICPFIFVQDGIWTDGKTKMLLTIYLQFDRDGLTLHVPVDLQNYDKAVTVEVFKGRKERTFIPLVIAHQHKPDDVRIECDFEGGKLWGWFPKECAI